MRFAILVPVLMLAACDSAKKWENQQAELANEANGVMPAEEPANVGADTDYVNATSPAANDVNAVAPDSSEVNESSPVENEPAPPPEG